MIYEGPRILIPCVLRLPRSARVAGTNTLEESRQKSGPIGGVDSPVLCWAHRNLAELRRTGMYMSPEKFVADAACDLRLPPLGTSGLHSRSSRCDATLTL